MDIKNSLFKFSEKINMDKLVSKVYMELYNPNKDLMINSTISHDFEPFSDEIFLFPLMYGRRSMEMAFNSILSYALNFKGIKTKFILCDNIMPICLQKTSNHSVNCQLCKLMGQKFANNYGIPMDWAGKYVYEDDVVHASSTVSSLSYDECLNLEYKNINVNKYAIAASKRFLLKGEIENKERDIIVLKEYLAAALLHVDLSEKIFQIIKPSHVVLSNIAYLPGIFVEYFGKNGVNCIVCDLGKQNNTLNLNHLNNDQNDINQVSKDIWNIYSKKELMKEQKDELRTSLNYRKEGLGMHVDHGQFSNVKSVDKIIESLNIDINRNTGILFTNLPWDASLAGIDIVFENSFLWVDKTIDYFVNNPQKNLVIKVHPAEEIHGTKMSFIQHIHNKFLDLPDNIKIIPPKSNIDTYGLFDIADYGIVYTTTTGLEMAIEGVPIITTAYTHYREKGFTFDATNMAQYMKLLNNSENLKMDNKMMNLAQKYGYLHFCDREIPFKFIEFSGDYFSDPKLKLKDWKDISLNLEKNLDGIVECMTSGKSILKSNF